MTLEQVVKFNAFLLIFSRLSNNRVIKPIYRGDALESLYNKLGVALDTSKELGHKELLSRLFLIGDKPRNYLSKEHFGLNRRWTFDINECSESVYNFIFDTISDCIKRHKVPQVQKFFTRNESFKQYFLDKSGNKRKFVNMNLQLPREKQVVIRNYYLKLLHQIGSINYRDRSHLVSTSSSYSIAKKFATRSRSSNGIILHAWEPVFSRSINLTKTGLPSYVGKPYNNQQEVSITAGIFPHFIIGLEILSAGRLYVNPNIFSTKLSKQVFTEGLDINQSTFIQVIQKTNYSKYVTSSGSGQFDSNV